MFQENQEIFRFLFFFLLSLIVIIFLMISIFILFRKKQLQLRSEIDFFKLKHEDEILKTQLEIQEYTFKKISREIHDNISLGLTLAKLQTTTYLGQADKDPKMLEFSIDLISKSLVDLNDISKSMDANQLISHGLIKALESEVTVLSKSGLYDIEMALEGEPLFLDAESDLVLLRIFQEACNNIIKHARASEIKLLLKYETDRLTMKINDNGEGFDLEKTLEQREIRKKSGLQNIMARAKLIQATVNIHSVLGKGTSIEITTPIKNNQHGTNHQSSCS
jgi:two-component system NarL family sensor kinase